MHPSPSLPRWYIWDPEMAGYVEGRLSEGSPTVFVALRWEGGVLTFVYQFTGRK